jgi:hypothetical protein
LCHPSSSFGTVDEEFAIEQQLHPDMGDGPCRPPPDSRGREVIEYRFLARREPAVGMEDGVGCMMEGNPSAYCASGRTG